MRDDFGDLTNEEGLPGQGATTPVEKVFDFHFIVQIPSASGKQYFDPSYGVIYGSETDFEAQALAGYAQQTPAERGTSKYHFAVSGSVPLNIAFSINTIKSM